MGVIRINGLKLRGRHGVFDQERRVGNEFEINIMMDVPMADAAALGDDLELTVNYAEVVNIAKEEMRVPSSLIEAVAYRIANSIKARYGEKVAHCQVAVAKLAPPLQAELDSVSYTYSI